jgi:catechol 2,3-dioxygenase-like lactoylglutathione lyase family enzyme
MKNRLVDLLGRLTICFLLFVSLISAAADRPKIYRLAWVRLDVSDMAQARKFYLGALALQEHKGNCSISEVTCLWIDKTQKLELRSVQPSKGENTVEGIAFLTDDLERMRRYLISKDQNLGKLSKNFRGEPFFDILDPEGHRITFVSGWANGGLKFSPVSQKLIHAGWVVKNRAAMDAFYKDILGFHLYWQGGMKDDEVSWVSMQVPDGTDWIECMLNIPADADKHLLGVMNHIALGVPDVHAAAKQLEKNGFKLTEQPKMGRDGKWQLNLYDPDDTRVELMEFAPVEKPCCSEFTGTHPKP